MDDEGRERGMEEVRGGERGGGGRDGERWKSKNG